MEEIFVALMGVTGAGKSSFIKLLCSTGNQEIKIGHNLKSCTAVLDVYQCKYDQNTIINLIDTPGFDDTDRTDSEVLRQITPWLTNTYRKNIQLSGIIYLHRITDTLMQGSAIRNLTNFKALCGPDALKNVILATSVWDKVDKLEGEEHEKELRNERDWWGWMCEKGSTTVRHDNTSESARRIIGRFVSKPTVVLKIQHDLVDLGKSFDDTDVGIELNKERAKAEAKFRKERRKLMRDGGRLSKKKIRRCLASLLNYKTRFKLSAKSKIKATDSYRLAWTRSNRSRGGIAIWSYSFRRRNKTAEEKLINYGTSLSNNDHSFNIPKFAHDKYATRRIM